MLSENLKLLRSQKKVTQDDMAALLNIKRQTYSAYERGISTPDASSLSKIADFFNVSIDYLLEGKEKTASQEQSLTEKQKQVLSLAKNLSDEDMKKLIDYAELLTKANNQ